MNANKSEASKRESKSEAKISKNPRSATTNSKISIKPAPNGGNTSNASNLAQNSSKVQLRKPHNELTTPRKKDSLNQNLCTPVFGKTKNPCTPPDDTKKTNLKVKANPDVVSFEATACNIENIFYKEANDCVDPKVTKDLKLLIDVIDEKSDPKSKPSSVHKTNRKLLKKLQIPNVSKKGKQDAPKSAGDVEIDSFCGLDRNKEKRQMRPNTGNAQVGASSEAMAMHRSNYVAKVLSANESFSKIPLPTRCTSNTGANASTRKSPERKYDTFDSGKGAACINEDLDADAVRKTPKLYREERPSPTADRKCRFGRKRHCHKEQHQLKSLVAPASLESFKQTGAEYQRKDTLQEKNSIALNIPPPRVIASKIPQTVSSACMKPHSKTRDGTKSAGTQRRFVSKIPISGTCSVGIINNSPRNDFSKNSTTKNGASRGIIHQEEKQKAPSKILKYQIMAIPEVVYPEGLKQIITKSEVLGKEDVGTRKLRNISTEDTEVLETKKELESIFRSKPDFEKITNHRTLSQSQVSRRFSRKTEHKVKSRKFSNCKSRPIATSNKFELKSIVSSPETRNVKITESATNEVKCEQDLGETKLSTMNVTDQIDILASKNDDIYELLENLKIVRCVKCFSDTTLLKIYQKDDNKVCDVDKEHAEITRDEKSVQTLVDSSSMEVQVDFLSNLDSEEEPYFTSLSENCLCSETSVLSHEQNLDNLNPPTIKSSDSFGAILDYCADLLKQKTSLEKVLMECSLTNNVEVLEIGCQAEIFAYIDSFSQTSCLTTNRSCQCYQKKHIMKLAVNKLPEMNICSHETLPNNYVTKIQPYKSISFHPNNIKKITRTPSILLTLDKCAIGLDHKNSGRTMSCYCKEVPTDQKSKVEAERTKNLFEDDYDEDEYSETYMKELVQTLTIDKEVKICGSTPSLPEVVVTSDRCESKIEIPWLKISLAPPGFYEIKNMPSHPRQVLCDCWALSNGDDIYDEPVGVEAQGDVRICNIFILILVGELGSDYRDSDVVFLILDHVGKLGNSWTRNHRVHQDKQECICDNAQGGTGVIRDVKDKPPQPIQSVTKSPKPPASEIELPTQKPSRDKQPEEAVKVAATPPEDVKVTPKTSEPKPPEEPVEDPDEAEPPENNDEDNPTENPDEERPPETPDADKLVEEPENPPLPPPPTEEPVIPIPPEAPQPSEEAPSDLYEPPTESGGGQDGRIPNENSSSSSIPSTCFCLQPKDECDDMMGRPTDFVFDNSCVAQHEAYLDPLYRLFPDDCDTYCGPYIEMPWSDLTIPRNIKLRHVKKPSKTEKFCKCDKDKEADGADPKKGEVKEIIVCGNKYQTDTTPEKHVTSGEHSVDKADKGFEIQLSFTDVLGKVSKMGDKGIGTRPSTKDKSAITERVSRISNCRCASSKSQRPSPPQSKSSKCKNPHCKSTNSRSSVRIEPCPSYGKSSIYKGTSSSSRSPKRSTESYKPCRKGHYQDPVMNVLETCEAEMEPLRDTLNQLKSKIRNLNIPELSNWSGNSMQNSQCPPHGPPIMSLMPPSPTGMNRPLTPCVPGLSGISAMPPPQFPFSSMLPPHVGPPPCVPPTRICCPRCACLRGRRHRKKRPSSVSSTSDFSDYESVSEGESLCPFLRGLSCKNIYKEKDSGVHQRRCKTRESSEHHSKKFSNSASKRYNKRNQADFCRQDNGTDTEPEVQVHYGPKRPRMKTKQVFKSVVDPSMVTTKNQRLRIAVKVIPSDSIMSNDKLLAIKGPCDSKPCSKRSR